MCVAQTARRRRIQMRNDKRYASPRKDLAASQRRSEAKLKAARDRDQRKSKKS